MKRSVLFLALALAWLLVAGTAAAALAEGDLEQQAQEIGRLLKCPVCQNLSVADSPSQLAGQMRDSIREQLQAGQSKQQIIAFFVERYGDEVLLEPPKRGFGQIIWWGAAAIPLGGSVIVGLLVRRWRRVDRPAGAATIAGSGPAGGELNDYRALLERELRSAEAEGAW